MTELFIYSVLLVGVLTHLIFAALLYKKINADPHLGFHEKNEWRLKALVFPAYFWFVFKRRT
nr:hypothetical protein [Cytophagales bacterium]